MWLDNSVTILFWRSNLLAGRMWILFGGLSWRSCSGVWQRKGAWIFARYEVWLISMAKGQRLSMQSLATAAMPPWFIFFISVTSNWKINKQGFIYLRTHAGCWCWQGPWSDCCIQTLGMRSEGNSLHAKKTVDNFWKGKNVLCGSVAGLLYFLWIWCLFNALQNGREGQTIINYNNLYIYIYIHTYTWSIYFIYPTQCLLVGTFHYTKKNPCAPRVPVMRQE